MGVWVEWVLAHGALGASGGLLDQAHVQVDQCQSVRGVFPVRASGQSVQIIPHRFGVLPTLRRSPIVISRRSVCLWRNRIQVESCLNLAPGLQLERGGLARVNIEIVTNVS